MRIESRQFDTSSGVILKGSVKSLQVNWASLKPDQLCNFVVDPIFLSDFEESRSSRGLKPNPNTAMIENIMKVGKIY